MSTPAIAPNSLLQNSEQAHPIHVFNFRELLIHASPIVASETQLAFIFSTRERYFQNNLPFGRKSQSLKKKYI
jgi:hypothetical protein